MVSFMGASKKGSDSFSSPFVIRKSRIMKELDRGSYSSRMKS